MTPSIVESPNGTRPVPGMAHGTAPGEPATTPLAAPPAVNPRPVRAGTRGRRSFPAAILIASCLAIHLLAASLVYRELAGDLYAIFDATPRLLVLERGLTRLTAATVFLPPVVPTALVILAALWLGRRRTLPDVGRWLALSLVPLAADGVLRAVGVLIAPAPVNVGELLDLPVRFSPGPRLLLDLVGARPAPGLAYWAVVATVPAAISAWCVARALIAAEDAEREALPRRRRRPRATLDAMQVAVSVSGTWIALALAGQFALPWAAQLFLQTFG